MKKLAPFAAALTLAACASTQEGSGGAYVASAPSGTQYCWQDRLTTADGKLTCNWAPDRRAACEGATFTSVEALRYSAPKKATLCANGQWLVEVALSSGA